MNKAFITCVMKVRDPFYKEALQSLSMFRRKKGIAEPREWDRENIFYNPLGSKLNGENARKKPNILQQQNIKLGQLLR